MTEADGDPMVLTDIQRANIEYHRLLASHYHEQPFLRADNLERVRNILRQLSQVSGRSSLLDVCCGTGFVLEAGHELFEDLVGVDITREMLEKGLPRENVRTLLAPAEALPFPEGSFDVVTCNGALHHLSDLSKVFLEIRRVLRSGGTLYCDEIPSAAFRSALGEVQPNVAISSTVVDEIDRVTGDLARYEALGISKGVTQSAMVQCYSRGGLWDGEVKQSLLLAGFEKVEIHHRWFAGEGQLRATQGLEACKVVHDYLASILPLSTPLFKYFYVIAS